MSEELQHELIPKHTSLSEDEIAKLLETYNISVKQLPKIMVKDFMVKQLGAKVGDVIKITRKSPTVKTSFYYRLVIDG